MEPKLRHYQMDASAGRSLPGLILEGNAMLEIYWARIKRLEEQLYPQMDEALPEIPDSELPFNKEGEPQS